MANDQENILMILFGIALSFVFIMAAIIVMNMAQPASITTELGEIVGLDLEMVFQAMLQPLNLIPIVFFGVLSGLFVKMYKTDKVLQKKQNVVFTVVGLWIISGFVIAMNVLSSIG